MKFSKYNNPNKKKHYKKHSSVIAERMKNESARFNIQSLYYMELRSMVLSICYTIPGYKETTLENKNFIYDSIKATIEKYIWSEGKKPW